MVTRLAIFDFDGTLADTYPVFVDSLNALALKHRFRQVTHDEIRALRGLSAAEVLKKLQLPLWRVPAVASDFRRLLSERINEIQPFPGIVDALHAMAAERHIVLALATSNSMDNVKAVLGPALFSRFAAVECGSSLFGKSYRLRRILNKTRIARSEAIYIGDEIRDAEAAESADIRFGAVGWGFTDLEALLPLNPSKIFRVPADLLHTDGSNTPALTMPFKALLSKGVQPIGILTDEMGCHARRKPQR